MVASVASSSQLPYPKRIASFGRILFAVALSKADCFLRPHPLRIGRTQSPAQQFLLLGFFAFRLFTKASFRHSL